MVASVSPIARPRGRRTAFTPRPASLHAFPAARPSALRRVRLGHVLAASGLALLPWMAFLAFRMPSEAHVTNWSAAWVGLDAMLALGLVGTGLLAVRRDPRMALPAVATSALLFMDAWFDVLTAAPGADRACATLLAAGVELPLAVVCAVMAYRAFPGPAADRA
ncbi:hypothetical protein [Actinomadura oligospora]|uniref:hypothetical protein n=1 Tax=Actinomadura oligospora TaxID=111804 RepID=UPI0004B2DCB2|nr:hypothetical protein [Actinomadura oligospora]